MPEQRATPRPASGRRCCSRRPRPRSGRRAARAPGAWSARRPAPAAGASGRDSMLTTGTVDDRGHPLDDVVVEHPGGEHRVVAGHDPGDVLDGLADVEADLLAARVDRVAAELRRRPSPSTGGCGWTASRRSAPRPGPRSGRPSASIGRSARSSTGRSSSASRSVTSRKCAARRASRQHLADDRHGLVDLVVA